jgi:hypothetical protein
LNAGGGRPPRSFGIAVVSRRTGRHATRAIFAGRDAAPNTSQRFCHSHQAALTHAVAHFCARVVSA